MSRAEGGVTATRTSTRMIRDIAKPEAYIVADTAICLEGFVPNKPVIQLINNIAETSTMRIIIVSPLSESSRQMMQAWLDKHVLFYDVLLMAPDSEEYWSESVIKYGLYRETIRPTYQVVGVFDDSFECAAMWRKQGLTVYQVAN
jgi:hypothetical protein